MIRKIQIIINSNGKCFASAFNASPEEATHFNPYNYYARCEFSPTGDILLTNTFDASDPDNAEEALMELYGQLLNALDRIKIKTVQFMGGIDGGEICEDKFFSKESDKND